MAVFQPSLLTQGALQLRPLALERTPLDAGSWVDRQPEWLQGATSASRLGLSNRECSQGGRHLHPHETPREILTMDKEWTYETIYTECQGLGEDEVERKLEENAWFGGREIAALKWLQTSQRDRAAKQAEEVRQEAVETRKIAQQAKEIAQRANWIALAAELHDETMSIDGHLALAPTSSASGGGGGGRRDDG